MTKEDLQDAIKAAKVHYFRERGSAYFNGHNAYKGCHGKDPKTCKACISFMVAEINHKGLTFVGVAFRNVNDPIRRKIGRLIAVNRAVNSALLNHFVDPTELRELIDTTYNDPAKADWNDFMNLSKDHPLNV